MYVTVTQKDIEVMFHSKKSLLYKNELPWVKKKGKGFDVTMGVYGGTEICELISIFMLSLTGKKYVSENIELYSDNGLSIFRNASGPRLEKIKNSYKKYSKKKC